MKETSTESCVRFGIWRSRFASLWGLIRLMLATLLLHASEPLDDVEEDRRQEDAE